MGRKKTRRECNKNPSTLSEKYDLWIEYGYEYISVFGTLIKEFRSLGVRESRGYWHEGYMYWLQISQLARCFVCPLARPFICITELHWNATSQGACRRVFGLCSVLGHSCRILLKLLKKESRALRLYTSLTRMNDFYQLHNRWRAQKESRNFPKWGMNHQVMTHH